MLLIFSYRSRATPRETPSGSEVHSDIHFKILDAPEFPGTFEGLDFSSERPSKPTFSAPSIVESDGEGEVGIGGGMGEPAGSAELAGVDLGRMSLQPLESEPLGVETPFPSQVSVPEELPPIPANVIGEMKGIASEMEVAVWQMGARWRAMRGAVPKLRQREMLSKMDAVFDSVSALFDYAHNL